MNWSTSFPTEPGTYWFHGWRTHNRDEPAKTTRVRVFKDMRGLVGMDKDTGEWTSPHPVTGCFGLWLPYDVPTPPSLDRGACYILINEKDEVLVSRRRPDVPAFPGYLQFPGGLVNIGETARDGAQRELNEETGVYQFCRETHALPFTHHGEKLGRMYGVSFFYGRCHGSTPHLTEPTKNEPWEWRSLTDLVACPDPMLPGNREACEYMLKHNTLGSLAAYEARIEAERRAYEKELNP